MYEAEIVSLEQFETMNKSSKNPPKRPYKLLLWDRTSDNRPCWESELFKFRPEDLIEKNTSASITLRTALMRLAKERDIKKLTCMITSGTFHFAKPIAAGYYKYLIEDIAKSVKSVKRQEMIKDAKSDV